MKKSPVEILMYGKKENRKMMKERLPNLICPGAEKAGTTSLYSILKQHSEIYNCGIKEPMFFNRYFDKGLKAYSKLYKGASEEKYIMDFTVLYMTNEAYVQRMLDTLGSDIKIIIMLRNPVDRFYSQFYMKRKNASESETEIANVFHRDYELFKKNPDTSEYFSHGLYGRQVSWFIERYPVENLIFVLFDDFINDTFGTVSSIFRFLNLEFEPGIKIDVWKNKTIISKQSRSTVMLRKLIGIVPQRIKTAIPTKLRIKFLEKANKIVYSKGEHLKSEKNPILCREIFEAYKEDVLKLQHITGLDLSIWKDKYSR